MGKKKRGWAANEELNRGIPERGESPTDGEGNTLPEAPYYRLECPNKRYIGASGFQGGVIVFQNGIGRTDDRDLAWMVAQEYGYQVTPEFPGDKNHSHAVTPEVSRSDNDHTLLPSR